MEIVPNSFGTISWRNILVCRFRGVSVVPYSGTLIATRSILLYLFIVFHPRTSAIIWNFSNYKGKKSSKYHSSPLEIQKKWRLDPILAGIKCLSTMKISSLRNSLRRNFFGRKLVGTLLIAINLSNLWLDPILACFLVQAIYQGFYEKK